MRLNKIVPMAIAVSVAIGTFGSAVEAATTKKKHKRAFREAPVSQSYGPKYQRGPQAGPAWSGPNQCWTDEGYGRYTPCDTGGKSF